MKKFIALFLLCVCVAQMVFAADIPTFYAKTEKAFHDYHVVGGSFVVYHNFEPAAVFHYGMADKRAHTLVEEFTKFKIASITKMVSAIGLMQLVEKGYCSLDDDISHILGYKVRNPYFKNVPITVGMLVSHTSSIQDSARSAHKRGTVAQMLGPNRVNDNAFANVKPGTKYIYSNFGFGLIGIIIEQISGKTLQQYMKENVFTPLNIDAGYSVQELQTANVAARYQNGVEAESIATLQKQELSAEIDVERNYNVSVGKLLISAQDLSKLLMVLAGDGSYNGVNILSSDSVLQMRSVAQNISLYGVGIERKDNIIENITLYGHQGLYYSAYCDAYFDPENNITMVLLTNGQDVRRIEGTNALARQLFMLTYKYLIDIPQNPYLVTE
ncbi:MAG: serine hydrolase domain-containing protein [Eubacteriales bacterium]|nr:serine hydrolase domain-containing protein [Eubacteriales bacterium]